MNIFRTLVVITCLFGLNACTSHKLKTGTWRGILKPAHGGELPFNFELKDTADHLQLTIINANERFKVNDIKMQNDSVLIHMPLFDSEFKLQLKGDSLVGNFIKHLGDHDAVTPFTAYFNQNWRFFKAPETAAYNITGRWSAVFNDDGNRDTTVGEFNQQGNKVTGTFLTTTGDYRYLEGTVSGNQLYLSCFDGGHAFLFTANLLDSTTMTNGFFGTTKWTAIKNQNAKLPDAYSLTVLKPGYKKIDFSFPDLDGKKTSLTDEQFNHKVVVLQVMGSWCPNCMDETAYLVNFYNRYHTKGVEVIGLAYERSADFDKARNAVMREKEHFNIPYTLLLTGHTNNKAETAQSLPMLSNFLAFPTTIIIDKKGNVRKIYTGFSGPGTGVYYTQFINRFEAIINNLLAEK